MASLIVIGGPSGAADLETVVQVAQGQVVTLDAPTADRIKKESPPPKDFKLEDQPKSPGSDEQALDIVEARAGILCRLISLANGSTKLRLAVVQYLADILNAPVNVQLTSAATDSVPLCQIADAVAGNRVASQDSNNAPSSETPQQKQLTPPGLSQHERTVLLSGQWITLGVAAVTVQNARQLLLGATAVAALSAEALQTQVRHVSSTLLSCTSPHYVRNRPSFHWTFLVAPKCCCCRSRQSWKISMLARPPMTQWVHSQLC